ncbi:hypothetical protein FACS1894182_03680 [Bacteroidia bacterium]|nr:hypothetical protein FACS1894182_03680 [Bacteroidia bacterium]
MRVHFFKHVVIGLAIVAGFSAVVMLLWNFAIPGIFGLTAINFWQALGLLALARILFGGLGGMFRGGNMHSHPNSIREKWMKMTPQERKEFIHKRHEHSRRGGCHRGDFFGENRFDFDNEPKQENE